MATEDDELRARAAALVQSRRKEPEEENTQSVAPASQKHKRNAGELAKAAVAPGAGIVALIAVLQQLLSARVTPEQLTALRQRVDSIEEERAARRVTEFERDRVAKCRSEQLEESVRHLLPRPDQQVGPPPKPWFDRCPELPEPTTGAKLPLK